VASVAVPHATGVNQQAVAAQENVDVFHRFALMRHWHDIDGMPFEAFLSRDGLHMNDWSYNCFAKALADAIANAATPRENSNASANATTGETR
jgi:acyl-CoA thioesterase-1